MINESPSHKLSYLRCTADTAPYITCMCCHRSAACNMSMCIHTSTPHKSRGRMQTQAEVSYLTTRPRRSLWRCKEYAYPLYSAAKLRMQLLCSVRAVSITASGSPSHRLVDDSMSVTHSVVLRPVPGCVLAMRLKRPRARYL